MANLFSFKALELYPLKNYQSLVLEFKNEFIDPNMIRELEIFFNWACNHLEVKSILITSKGAIFSQGLDLKEFKKYPQGDFEKFLNRYQMLIYSLFFLPQTIVVDLKQMACGAGAEFAIGADFRLAQKGTKINFDHLKKGLVPSCGGIGFLDAIVPQTFVRKWILSAGDISERDLVNSGLIHELYDTTEKESGHKILEQISKLAPIPRIQAKRSLLESILPKIERALEFESKFAFAGMSLGDWKKILEKKGGKLSSPKDLSKLLKFKEKSRQ